MTRLARFSLMAAILGLTACASTPSIQYHTLMAPSRPAAAPGTPAPFLIEVLPVGIPAQLDRSQLVVRQGTGGVAVLETERWAGPLVNEIREALSAQLTQRLGTQDIAGLARPPGKPLVRVKLQVRRFDAWPGQSVQLDAGWSLGMADEAGNTRLACHGNFEEPASGGYPELVRAQQRAIASLAARIAADAGNWASSRSAACSGRGS